MSAPLDRDVVPPTTPRRIAVVGSRAYPRLDAVRMFVAKLRGATDVVIVSGGAPGVDNVAAATARKSGLPVEVFLADWERYGRSAGFRRNADIVARCTEVVAFWDGQSKGTAHTIALARRRGRPCMVIGI